MESIEEKLTVREQACSAGCMLLATCIQGAGTGLVGVFIAHLIRDVQILGFGHDHGGFLEIALEADPYRRMICVLSGGLIGAIAWYWLRGRPTYLVSVDESLKGAKMPPVATVLNAMVQDIVVALGGSFGREAAPREIAAMWGGAVGDVFRVSSQQRKVLVACGAGAGLAAVYSVPISGAFYTIEHVLNWDVSPRAVLPAILTSVIATIVTSSTVETGGLYSMPRYSYEWPSWKICLWALLVGPAAGLGAAGFRRFIKLVEGYKPLGRFPVEFKSVQPGDSVWLTRDKDGYICRVKAKVINRLKDDTLIVQEPGEVEEEFDESDWEEAHAEGRRDWTIFLLMPTAFLALALLSRYYPSLLGNGRALAEIAMQRQGSSPFLAMLLLLKALMTAAAIGSGAAGGTLTPSVALGATLGAIVGEYYQLFFPHLAPAEDARMSVVAAAAFLSVAMKSPVTGLWLLVEFSAQGIGFDDIAAVFRGDLNGIEASKAAMGMLIPMALAVLGATGSVKLAGYVSTSCSPSRSQVSDAPTDPNYKLLIRKNQVDDSSDATTRTPPSNRDADDLEAKLQKDGGSSLLTLSQDDLLKELPVHRKPARMTIRSMSTSVDLDLPELHGPGAPPRRRSFSRMRSISDSSYVLHSWVSGR